jgi:hypothetical protein
MVCINALYFEADIVKWTETESTLHDNGIQGKGFDGVALDKKTVGDVLKIPKHLTFISTPQERQRSGETDMLSIMTNHTPLSKQVTGLTSFLTRGQQKNTKQKN